jgi:hypothetical protein
VFAVIEDVLDVHATMGADLVVGDGALVEEFHDLAAQRLDRVVLRGGGAQQVVGDLWCGSRHGRSSWRDFERTTPL